MNCPSYRLMTVQMLYQLIFVVSLFFINYCHTYTVEAPSAEEDNRVDVMMNLIARCSPKMEASLLITDSSSNLLYRDFYKDMVGSVLLFNNSTHIQREEKIPVPFVIMILSSPSKVTDVLVDERWRDFNQNFVILDDKSDNECVNAQIFLMEAWKNDILNVIFLCSDQKENQKLFTFNPFIEFAPMSWQKVAVVPGINDHPWTLFSQNYNPDTVWSDIFFEKARNVGRYIVKAAALTSHPYVSYEIIAGEMKFRGYDYIIIKLLTDSFNATLITTEIASIVDDLENSNNSEGIFWKVGNNKVDLSINSLISRNTLRKVESTYALYDVKINVITQQRKFTKFGGQLFTFLPLSITIFLFITSIIIYNLLHYVFQDPYSRNFIDIFRVYLNLPLPTLPLTVRGRILFGTALASFTIANIVIQANMNTVMTSKNTARNVEVFENLKEFKLKVYSSPFIRPTLIKIGIEVTKVSQNLSCSEVKKHEAYVGKEYILRTRMSKTCHMPKKPIISGVFSAYYTRRNWPIFPQLNKKLLVSFECGLVYYLSERNLRNYTQPKPQESEQYQVISMDHMIYVFYAYIIGMLTSAIVFFMELYLAWLSRTMN